MVSLSIACSEPGYREEVYPGQQGQYTVKRVPVAPSARIAPAAAPTEAPPETDADLAQIKSAWPRLSASDRAAVVDMTRHLAQRSGGNP